MGVQKRIWIDAGHGGIDPGTHGQLGARTYYEKELVVRFQKVLSLALSAHGHQIHFTRTKKIGWAPIWRRAQRINGWNPNILISLHANGVTNPKAKGFEAICRSHYIEPELEHPSHRLSRLIVAEVKAAGIGLHGDGLIVDYDEISKKVLYRNLGMLRRPKVLSRTLLELGFMTNPGELIQLLDPDYMKKMADAITRGVQKHIGV